MMKRFPRSVCLYALVVALLTSLPYIVGYVSTPPGWRYGGEAIVPSGAGVDFNSHIAIMWQGSRGQWSQHMLFTDEPHPDLPLVRGFYVFLGELTRIIPINLALMYHLARFVLTFGMVLAIWSFASRFFEKSSERWLVTLFATIVSGWSWLLLIFDPAMVAQVSPIEFWLIDAFNLLGALYMPHFAAAVILQIVVVLTFDDWVRSPVAGRYDSRLIILTLALAGGAIVQPYVALLLIPLMVILTAYHIFSAKRLSWQRALWLLIPISIHAALVVYQYIAINSDPIWAKFAAQNQTLSPSVIYYLLGYLPFIIPIVIGFRIFLIGDADDRWWIPILWVALVAALLYAPLPTQRRYLLGVQTPLAVMAAFGWSRAILPRLRQQRAVLLSAVYFTLGAAALAVVVMANIAGLSQPDKHVQVYDRPDEILAYNWLEQNSSPNDLIFITFDAAETGRGNRLVAAIGHRVLIGHWIETVDFEEKVAELKQFYDSATSDSWRRDFLKRIGAAFIWYDEYAHQFGDWNPASADYLTAVFHSDMVTIWKVN